MARLIDHVNKAQRSSGDLRSLTTKEYQGFKYTTRVDSNKESYYFVSDHFFAYTSKESLLKRLLEQKRLDRRDVPPMVEHLKKAGGDNAVASLWINPRCFDDSMKQKIAAAKGTDALFWESAEHSGRRLTPWCSVVP